MPSVGERYRIVGPDILGSIEGWKYLGTPSAVSVFASATYPAWRHVMGAYLLERYIGEEVEILDDLTGPGNIHCMVLSAGEAVWLHVSALEPISTCECSRDRFGFVGHEKWCPEWAPLM